LWGINGLKLDVQHSQLPFVSDVFHRKKGKKDVLDKYLTSSLRSSRVQDSNDQRRWFEGKKEEIGEKWNEVMKRGVHYFSVKSLLHGGSNNSSKKSSFFLKGASKENE
jgi:hypothetical protein